MTDRMTQSTKGTFKKQWHKDSTVTLISLHKLILQFSTKSSGKTTTTKKIPVEICVTLINNNDMLTKKSYNRLFIVCRYIMFDLLLHNNDMLTKKSYNRLFIVCRYIMFDLLSHGQVGKLFHETKCFCNV